MKIRQNLNFIKTRKREYETGLLHLHETHMFKSNRKTVAVLFKLFRYVKQHQPPLFIPHAQHRRAKIFECFLIKETLPFVCQDKTATFALSSNNNIFPSY